MLHCGYRLFFKLISEMLAHWPERAFCIAETLYTSLPPQVCVLKDLSCSSSNCLAYYPIRCCYLYFPCVITRFTAVRNQACVYLFGIDRVANGAIYSNNRRYSAT